MSDYLYTHHGADGALFLLRVLINSLPLHQTEVPHHNLPSLRAPHHHIRVGGVEAEGVDVVRRDQREDGLDGHRLRNIVDQDPGIISATSDIALCLEPRVEVALLAPAHADDAFLAGLEIDAPVPSVV